MSFLATLGRRARVGQCALNERALVALCTIATLVIVLSHLAFLTKYPIVFIDEPKNL